MNGFDPIVEAVRSKLLIRSALGLSKYGVTVAGAALSREQWLIHAQEEALDLAIYLERLLSENAPESANAAGVSSLGPELNPHYPDPANPSSSATVRGPMENDIIERIEPEDWSVLDPFFKEKDVPMNDIPLTQLGHEIEQLFYPSAPESRKRRPLEKILFKAKLSVPSGIEGQPAEEVPRIYSRCWACRNDTLTINNGHLLCTWIDCPNPTLMDSPPLPDNGEAVQTKDLEE